MEWSNKGWERNDTGNLVNDGERKSEERKEFKKTDLKESVM